MGIKDRRQGAYLRVVEVAVKAIGDGDAALAAAAAAVAREIREGDALLRSQERRAPVGSSSRTKGRNPGPGVTMHVSGRYRVNVHNPFTGKRVHGGYFDDADEACRAAQRIAQDMGAPYPEAGES